MSYQRESLRQIEERGSSWKANTPRVHAAYSSAGTCRTSKIAPRASDPGLLSGFEHHLPASARHLDTAPQQRSLDVGLILIGRDVERRTIDGHGHRIGMNDKLPVRILRHIEKGLARHNDLPGPLPETDRETQARRGIEPNLRSVGELQRELLAARHGDGIPGRDLLLFGLRIVISHLFACDFDPGTVLLDKRPFAPLVPGRPVRPRRVSARRPGLRVSPARYRPCRPPPGSGHRSTARCRSPQTEARPPRRHISGTPGPFCGTGDAGPPCECSARHGTRRNCKDGPTAANDRPIRRAGRATRGAADRFRPTPAKQPPPRG